MSSEWLTLYSTLALYSSQIQSKVNSLKGDSLFYKLCLPVLERRKAKVQRSICGGQGENRWQS